MLIKKRLRKKEKKEAKKNGIFSAIGLHSFDNMDCLCFLGAQPYDRKEPNRVRKILERAS
jgi:hypothetical protein